MAMPMSMSMPMPTPPRSTPWPTSPEEIRGLEPISLEELALVFHADGDTYLRLESDSSATAHGTPRLTTDGDAEVVIAPVGIGALPADLRAWANREVLVDGVCKARVTGFAEVSRVIGDASDPYAWDEDGEPIPPEPWTVDRVRETGVMLAAKLDGCAGTWARAAAWAPAAIVAKVEAPALEGAAEAEMIARFDAELADAWKEQGAEGAWQDHADFTTSTWQHPLTNERWVFVQASHPGSCGEPYIGATAVYRVGADNQPRFAARLGTIDLTQVIDLDGDGQPELVTGDGEGGGMRDLTDNEHASIYVPRREYGCGC